MLDLRGAMTAMVVLVRAWVLVMMAVTVLMAVGVNINGCKDDGFSTTSETVIIRSAGTFTCRLGKWKTFHVPWTRQTRAFRLSRFLGS